MGSYLSFFGPKTSVEQCNGEKAAECDEGSNAVAETRSSEIAIDEKQTPIERHGELQTQNEINGGRDELNGDNSVLNENSSKLTDFDFGSDPHLSNIEDEHCSVSSTIISPTANVTYDEVVESFSMNYSGNQGISSSLEATRDTLIDSDLNATTDVEDNANGEQDSLVAVTKEEPANKTGSFVQEKIGDYFFCTFPKCKSKFKKLGHFERHLVTVHDVKSPHPHNESLESTSASSPQIEVKHPSGKPFVCTYVGCSKSYKTRSSYIKHVEAHERESPVAMEQSFDGMFGDGRRKRNLSQTDRSSVSSRSGSVGSKSDRSSLCDSTTYQNGQKANKKKRK